MNPTEALAKIREVIEEWGCCSVAADKIKAILDEGDSSSPVCEECKGQGKIDTKHAIGINSECPSCLGTGERLTEREFNLMADLESRRRKMWESIPKDPSPEKCLCPDKVIWARAKYGGTYRYCPLHSGDTSDPVSTCGCSCHYVDGQRVRRFRGDSGVGIDDECGVCCENLTPREKERIQSLQGDPQPKCDHTSDKDAAKYGYCGRCGKETPPVKEKDKPSSIITDLIEKEYGQFPVKGSATKKLDANVYGILKFLDQHWEER